MREAISRILDTYFPHQGDLRYSLRTAIFIGLFVSLFLLAYQPFGVGDYHGSYRLLRIAGYGLPCMLPTLLQGFAKKYLISVFHMAGKWKTKHELLLLLPMLMLVGLFNSLYTTLAFDYGLTLEGVLRMQVYTLLVGLFPSSAIVGFELAREVMANRALAQNMNDMFKKSSEIGAGDKAVSRQIELRSESGGECMCLDPDTLCFIKAEGNYVEVTHCKLGGKAESNLLRLPLKEAGRKLSEQGLVLPRCHRSYLVNTARICRAEGNAQGLTLHLDRDNLTIPVSRSFVSEFR